MIIIGITGTIGAGKGTLVEYLKTKGFKHYSVREILLKEISRRNIEPTREHMALVADDFRKISPGHIMEMLLKEAQSQSAPAVIESIRALGEINVLRERAQDFYLCAVDADPKVRYERIIKRKSTTDFVTYDTFLADEAAEMNNTEPWKMNMAGCIRQADFVFRNDGSIETFYAHVEAVLKEILV